MGKIVKYCNACEEGFAEKFGFCPNCGAHLTAFEMNPLEAAAPEPVVEDIPEPAIIAAPAVEPVAEPVIETAAAVEDVIEEPAVEAAEPFEFEQEVFEPEPEPAKTVAAVAAPTAAFSSAPKEEAYKATYQPRQSATNDGFRVTIVEEKNVKQRNMLLLGTFVILFAGLGIAFLYSLFNKFLDVAAIDTPDLIAFIDSVEPVPIEEIIEKKDKDKGGGGGGGGKDEETEASKGREAAQNDNPMFAPSARMNSVTNPAIPIEMATKNKNERAAEKTDEPYGLRNGIDGISDGSGSGGGLGDGRGRGQGGGEGRGLGNGIGDGRGDGEGDGEGNGKGPGGNGDLNGLTVKTGPTVGVKIISKPRPGYTDAARVNNIQGTVVLRVTFNANGTIGGVSVVKGLPNGLTEQAIAAAKGIRFEPAKRSGSPYAVSKNVEYSFTIF